MVVPSVTLNNGCKMPNIGLGTMLATPKEVGDAIKFAIDIGYRHFDCAMLYKNEAEVGAAIREKIAEGIVKREDIFVVSKLWNTFHEKELVVPTCKKTLESFGLDYIDLYLIHWPIAQDRTGFSFDHPFTNPIGKDYDYVETWKGMEECQRLGLTKSIGLSNFNIKQIERVLNNATIKPVVNQVEAHPLLNQEKLRNFCKAHGVAITGYAPLGSPARRFAKPGDPMVPLNDPKLLKIGNKYGKTGAQVILRYLLDIGITPLPKSTNPKRLSENINVFDFCLLPEDIEIINTFNSNTRLYVGEEFKHLPNYPFKDNE